MIRVTWDEAKAFCEWAGVPLPTEAQWEYARRAGRQSKYFFGDDAAQLGDYAWIGKNAGWRTHSVKTKKANEWGRYDMYGNGREWCEDQCSVETFKSYYQSARRKEC